MEKASPQDIFAKGRIQSLDGLRAVSILAVTISHYAKEFCPMNFVNNLNRLGATGVDVFFVISGFLITSLMLREHDKHGKISLTGFYRRRSLRIFPAYFFLLFFVFVLSRLGWLLIDNHAWPYLLTYTLNLNTHLYGKVPVPQVWSLCVEEHFYFLWPITFVVLGKRRAPVVLFASILIAIPVRFWLYLHHSVMEPDWFTPTRIDTIAVGCLLAYAFRQRWIERIRGERMAIGAALVLFASLYLIHSGKYELGPRHLVDASMIAVIIACFVQDASGPLGRMLNWRPVAWIGTLSYSLYLAQTIVFTHLVPLAWRIPAAILYACFSYYLIELPFLKLKDKGRSGLRMQKSGA